MKVDWVQNNFATGEIGPSLYGRSDIAQYRNACAIVENFLCRPYGSLLSTPGTKYINEAKLSAAGTDSTVRLMKFIFNRTDAYVIEAGENYFRFYTDQAVVVSTGTTPYELAHTYTAEEVKQIQYAQLNDVIYLVHPNHPPRKLTRLASNSWTIADLDFYGGPFLDENTGPIAMSASATASGASTTITTSAPVFTVSSSSTKGHVNTYWKFAGVVTSATTGLDEQGYFKITAVSTTSIATGTVLNALSTNYSTQWAEGSWSDVRGWPARVTFHNQRLFFARTDYQPQNVWGSQPFIYNNFLASASYDDDSLNLALASSEANEIRWLASGKSLLGGTFGGEFSINGGSEGSVITPSNAVASPQTGWGSEAIEPRKVGSFFYYIQRFGKKLREIYYSWDIDSYKSEDQTILAPHISGGAFLEIDYQQTPDNILWAVCTNGTIATLTREVDQQVRGWARQTTTGTYESIAIIPSASGEYDEVYVVVKRYIDGAWHRYIEVFQDMIVPDRQDLCWYVHSGLQFSAYDLTSTSSSTISLSGTAGTITITCSTSHFSSTDVGQRIRAIDADGTTVGELEITGYTSGTIIIGTVKYAFDATSYAAGLWGLSVEEISGLDHLEAETVVVLADGGTDKPDKVVSNGTISLEYDYFVVTAGLPYYQTVKTLPFEAGSARGTAQGKIQRINEVAFRVNRSHKGFYVGGSDDLLERVQFRQATTLMGTPEALFTGIIPNIPFNGDYERGAQIQIENRDPLPIELLNIMATVTTEEK